MPVCGIIDFGRKYAITIYPFSEYSRNLPHLGIILYSSDAQLLPFVFVLFLKAALTCLHL